MYQETLMKMFRAPPAQDSVTYSRVQGKINKQENWGQSTNLGQTFAVPTAEEKNGKSVSNIFLITNWN